MRHSIKTAGVAALAVAALAPAATAQAASRSASLGYAGKPPKGTPESASFTDFFPRKLTIHAGDKVKYTIAGLLSVYSGPKSKVPPLAQFDAATPIAGEADPAGTPFWFNGQPTAAFNGAYLSGLGDGKVTKGQKRVDMAAVPEDEKAPPYVLRFPKAGTYTIRDAVHPDVTQTVKVVKKGVRIPGRAADRVAVAKQVAKLAKKAKKAEGLEPAANTLRIGNDSRNVELYQFFPSDLTVKAGQPVTIDAGAYVGDIHNLEIGPEAYMKSAAQKLLGAPGPGGLPLSGSAVYPSQPETQPLTFDPNQNGGYVSTGAFDTNASTPLPSKRTLTFTTPGTYHYVCLFHSDGVHGMEGMITVQ